MRLFFITLIFLFEFSSFASDKKEIFIPPLGTCSEYTDYYMYQCKPYKCILPIAKLAMTSIQFQIIGMKEDKSCEIKYTYKMRNPKFPPAEIKMRCILSERGRLEIANQFTQYKKGNLNMYISPPYNETLGKECSRY